jgi:hypothetical protein
MNLYKTADTMIHYVNIKTISLLYDHWHFQRAYLLKDEAGYQMRLHTGNEVFHLMQRGQVKPRIWKSVDRALDYIEAHFGALMVVVSPVQSQKGNQNEVLQSKAV